MSKTFKPICDVSVFTQLKKHYGYKRTSTKGGETRTYFVLTTTRLVKSYVDGVEVQCSFRPSDYERPDNIYITISSSVWEDYKPKCEVDGDMIFWCSQAKTGNVVLSNQKYLDHYSHYNPNGDITS